MKAKNIAYWIVTSLVALLFLFGGFVDLKGGPEMEAGMKALGYSGYVATILGFWKFLGGIALLLPKTPRLKEWAYAGIVFDLTGASYSHAVSGDPTSKVITPLVVLAFAVASWALRPESRKLAGPLV